MNRRARASASWLYRSGSDTSSNDTSSSVPGQEWHTWGQVTAGRGMERVQCKGTSTQCKGASNVSAACLAPPFTRLAGPHRPAPPRTCHPQLPQQVARALEVGNRHHHQAWVCQQHIPWAATCRPDQRRQRLQLVVHAGAAAGSRGKRRQDVGQSGQAQRRVDAQWEGQSVVGVAVACWVTADKGSDCRELSRKLSAGWLGQAPAAQPAAAVQPPRTHLSTAGVCRTSSTSSSPLMPTLLQSCGVQSSHQGGECS